MIRDRLPDLLELARSNPNVYNEPEAHPEVPLEDNLVVMFKRASKVTKYLSEIKVMMWKLGRLHERILTSASYREQDLCRTEISMIGNRFNALARKCKAVLKRFDVPESQMQNFSALKVRPKVEERSNRDDVEMGVVQHLEDEKILWHRLASGTLLPLGRSTYIPAEVRMRFHLHNTLSYQLTLLVRDYYVLQKIYGDQCKLKIQRQMSILGREMDEKEMEEAIHQGEQIPLLHREIEDDRVVDRQMQARLKEVEVLHQEILNIEKSVEELHKSFLTISNLIYEQGAIVDRIEEHVMISADYVEDSTQLLKKASSFQHKYRKKKLILFIILIVLILVIVIIIVVTVKKRHTNTTKVVVQKPKAVNRVIYVPVHPQDDAGADSLFSNIFLNHNHAI